MIGGFAPSRPTPPPMIRPAAVPLALLVLIAAVPAAGAGLTVSPLGRLPGAVSAEADHLGRPAKREAVLDLLGVDAAQLAAAQYGADLGGSTSVRNAAVPTWKDRGYYRRSRDLGQVFTPTETFTLDAVVLRTGNSYLAYRDAVAGAEVFVQFFTVTGTPEVDDNDTPEGTESTHGFSKHHRTDDHLRGVTYEPLRVVRGGVLPELPGEGKLTYLKWDFTGEDELTFEAGGRYAFMIGFAEPGGEPGKERNFTLANRNLAAEQGPPGLNTGADTYEGGWGLRREGKGVPPTLAPGPNPPADAALRAKLLDESSFGTGEDRYSLSPTTDGYPDVDTYRDLEFYLLKK